LRSSARAALDSVHIRPNLLPPSTRQTGLAQH